MISFSPIARIKAKRKQECNGIEEAHSAREAMSKVCVVGAGASGTLVASKLASSGKYVALLDMGRGAGGRSATRTTREGFMFDHGCSFLKAHEGLSPETYRTINSLREQGVLAPWHGRFGYIDSTAGFVSNDDPSFDMQTARKVDFFGISTGDGGEPLVGVPKASSLMEHLAKASGNISHEQARVTRIDWQGERNTWNVRGPTKSPKEGSPSDTDEDLGEYDLLVVSDPMLLLPGFPGATAAATDSSHVLTPLTHEFGKLQRSATFSLMLAFDSTSYMQEVADALPFDACTCANSEDIWYISRNSSKPGRSQDMITLVVLSTIKWANDRIAEQPLQQEGKYVPQTNEYLAKVQPMLFEAFKSAVAPALPPGFTWPEPTYARMQRWGAAFVDQPLAPNDRVFTDAEHRFIACGDFCTGKGVANALDSGNAAVHKAFELLGG